MTENSENIVHEHWFEACPAGLLILNQEGRVHAINPALCGIIGQQPDEILGQGVEQMPTQELTGLFHPDGQLQIFPKGLPPTRLKIESRVIPDSQGMMLRCFTDISEGEALKEENIRLQQQVEELTLTDKLTGLANERAFHRVLNAQVTRSRRYTNPLCLAVVEIDAAPEQEKIAQDIVLAVSRYLRDRLRWVDLIARWSDDRFMLVLPETSVEDASNTLNKIKNEFAATTLPEAITHLNIGLNFGIAEWQKGNDGRILMKRTMDALAEAKKAEANLTT